MKQISSSEITHDILKIFKHIISNNRYLRKSHFFIEENNKNDDPISKLGEGKEFEMKEFSKKEASMIDSDKNQIYDQSQQQICNVKVCSEEEEQRRMWDEDDLKNEESKKEENIKGFNLNHEFRPLIISHHENSVKNSKKNLLSKTKNNKK